MALASPDDSSQQLARAVEVPVDAFLHIGPISHASGYLFVSGLPVGVHFRRPDGSGVGAR